MLGDLPPLPLTIFRHYENPLLTHAAPHRTFPEVIRGLREVPPRQPSSPFRQEQCRPHQSSHELMGLGPLAGTTTEVNSIELTSGKHA